MKYDITKNNNEISTEISMKQANMSFVCACLVVFIHIVFEPMQKTWMWWGAQMLTDVGVTRIAVPFFFLSAGFNLAKHINGKTSLWWKKEITKRFFSLIIPYLLINIIYIIFVYIFYIIAKQIGYSIHISLPRLENFGDIVTAIGLNITKQSALYVLWFLRCLFVFVFISPILKIFINIRLVLPFTFCIIGIIMSILSENDTGYWYWFFDINFSLEGLFYFMFGIYLQKYPFKNKYLSNSLIGMIGILLGICLFAVRAFLTYIRIIPTIVYWFGWLGIPCLMYGIWSVMPQKTIINFVNIKRLSFPIYLIHYFLALILAGGIGVLGIREWSLHESFVFYIIRGFVLIVASIGLTLIIRKIVPRFAMIVFGKR